MYKDKFEGWDFNGFLQIRDHLKDKGLILVKNDDVLTFYQDVIVLKRNTIEDNNRVSGARVRGTTFIAPIVLNNKHQEKFSTIQLIQRPQMNSTHPINAPGTKGKRSLLLGCLYLQ